MNAHGLVAALVAAVAASCAPSASELRAPIDRDLARRLGVAVDPRAAAETAAAIDTLLAKPLDDAAAVRIALATNEHLAAAIAELGISGGELATATVLAPLAVDATVRFHNGARREYELSAIQDISSLFAAPHRRAAARADLAAARAEATGLAIAIAGRVEIAMHAAVAAAQTVELRRTAFAATDAAATLRERMRDAGNTTELAVARERDAREQARLDVSRAEAALAIARTRVDALLGLAGARTKAWTVDTRLLPVIDSPPPEGHDDLEERAVAESLALAADRARTTAATERAGAARIAAIVPELGVGVSVLDDPDSADRVAVGPALRIGLPVFGQQQGVRAAAAAREAAARHALAADTVDLRAHVRAARAAYVTAATEARTFRDTILPLRQQILDATLAHYNAMDADPFALVAARRALADAGRDYVDAVRRLADAGTVIAALGRGVDLTADLDITNDAEARGGDGLEGPR